MAFIIQIRSYYLNLDKYIGMWTRAGIQICSYYWNLNKYIGIWTRVDIQIRSYYWNLDKYIGIWTSTLESGPEQISKYNLQITNSNLRLRGRVYECLVSRGFVFFSASLLAT